LNGWVAIAILLALTLPAGAAQVMVVEFQQLAFWPEDGPPLELSGVGRCLVEYETDPQAEFLNIAALAPGHGAEPAWIVRNMWLHDDSVGPPFERQSMRFPLADLGVSAGELLGLVSCELRVSPEPLTDVEAEDWLLTTMLPLDLGTVLKEIKTNDGFTKPPTLPDSIPEPEVFWPGFVWPPHFELDSWIGCDMPNMELDSSAPGQGDDHNACVPAACANSLHWLATEHDDISLPYDQRETMNQLSDLMARLTAEGVGDSAMIRAKLDFIEANELPIEVKYQSNEAGGDQRSSTGYSVAGDSLSAGGWPTPDWILSEAASKEDVEIGVGYYTRNAQGKWVRHSGHCVVLTGGVRVCGVPFFAFKHDSNQDTDSGIDDQDHELSYGKVIGGRLWIPGMDKQVIVDGDTLTARAHVECAVSESRKAGAGSQPSEAPMDSFCVEREFIVPAHGGITFEFPDLAKRSLNVRLDVQDGVGDSATTRTERVWTRNAAKQRSWVNDSDTPVVVSIHNDDDTRDKKGRPIPWGVEVDIRKLGEPCTDSPSNPEKSGGTSAGSRDGSSGEYNQDDMGPNVQAGPLGEGFSYQDIPARISESKGTRDLEVFTHIPAWNGDWERLRFHLDVAVLHAPGQLEVHVLESGEAFLLDVAAAGRYSHEMWDLPPSPALTLHMTALGGLDMELDAFGCAPRLDVATSAPEGPPIARPTLAARPNPFNPSVTLSFRLPAAGVADLAIFDLRGRRVAVLIDGDLDAAAHAVVWDGRDDAGRVLPAGSYLCRLRAVGRTVLERVTLVK